MSRDRLPGVLLRSLDLPRPQPAPVAPSPKRRGLRRIAVAAAVLLSIVALPGAPAWAGPKVPPASDPPPIVSEGGTSAMRQQLNETQAAWLDAKSALDASIAHQQELIASLAQVEARIDTQTADLGKISHMAYVSAGYSRIASVMSAGMSDYLDGAGLIDALAQRELNLVQGLLHDRDAARQAHAGIDAEVAHQQELEQEMFKRNQQAEQALWAAAGGQNTSGFSDAASSVAEPARRNSDGSWPTEYIPHDRTGYPAVLERTVTGSASAGNAYITPRTAHAVEQAKDAGFTRYVACYRSGEDGGQHPRGKACDFAVDRNCTFCGSAEGDARSYGNQLAQYFVFNADRLGVLYVIWYRQIWLASTGRWKSYSGCCDPSSMHTNHVHLSMK